MGSLFSSSGNQKEGRTPVSRGREREHQVNDKDRAVLELKNARDRLKKYKKKLDSESERLHEQAKDLVRAKKNDRALIILKLRKHKQQGVENVEGQLLSVLQMIEDVEWSSMNVSILKALKVGTDALNQIHSEISVDEVAALMEDTNNAIEVENQINALFAGQFTSEDDLSLLEELNQLGEPTSTDIASTNSDTGAIIFPEVPTSVPTIIPAAPSHDIVLAMPEEEEEEITSGNKKQELLLS